MSFDPTLPFRRIPSASSRTASRLRSSRRKPSFGPIITSALKHRIDTGCLSRAMPLQAIIEHGARRDYVERKNSNRMVAYVRAENPRISFEFSGIIVGESATGFADQHPGTAVTALANFASSIHGFAPTDGKIIYKDPTRELSDTDEPQVSFTAEMFPGIAADD